MIGLHTLIHECTLQIQVSKYFTCSSLISHTLALARRSCRFFRLDMRLDSQVSSSWFTPNSPSVLGLTQGFCGVTCPRRLDLGEIVLICLDEIRDRKVISNELIPSFLPFRYSTSLLGEPGSPSIVVLCGCAFVWTMSKICVKEVC